MSPLNLIVLRSRFPRRTKAFYEGIGLVFQKEKHGGGPVHYAAETGGIVLEIYPTSEDKIDSVMLGFSVENIEPVVKALRRFITNISPANGRPSVVSATDPDGRRVRILQQKN